MSDPTHVLLMIVTADFPDQTNLHGIFVYTLDRNLFSAEYVCGHLVAAITSLPIYVRIQAKNHLLVIFVEENLRGQTRRSDMLKYTQKLEGKDL